MSKEIVIKQKYRGVLGDITVSKSTNPKSKRIFIYYYYNNKPEFRNAIPVENKNIKKLISALQELAKEK